MKNKNSIIYSTKNYDLFVPDKRVEALEHAAKDGPVTAKKIKEAAVEVVEEEDENTKPVEINEPEPEAKPDDQEVIKEELTSIVLHHAPRMTKRTLKWFKKLVADL